ncbi:hypothetical protein ABTX85_34230 [Streptomyces sp. NPDC096097]|uniref:hypothetical protein n=1 Tax=Streptomyces sp. NPDC096097 TaxID=3155546 RepID=UPI00331A6120
MAIEDKKTLLTGGADFEPGPYPMDGRTEEPPATSDEVIADRATWTPEYGSEPLLAVPVWTSPPDGGGVPSKPFQLCWTSNVGAAAGSAFTGTGSAAPDGFGITGHPLCITEGDTPPAEPSLTRGPLLNAIIDGFNAPSGEAPAPAWTSGTVHQ